MFACLLHEECMCNCLLHEESMECVCIRCCQYYKRCSIIYRIPLSLDVDNYYNLLCEDCYAEYSSLKFCQPVPLSGGSKVNLCQDCNIEFKHKQSLSRHRKRFGGKCLVSKCKKQYPRKCETCVKTYDTHTSFYNHKRTCSIVESNNVVPEPSLKTEDGVQCVDNNGSDICNYKINENEPADVAKSDHPTSFINLKEDVENLNITYHTFNHIDNFLAWKEETERLSYSYFSVKSGPKESKGIYYHYMTCQFHPEGNKTHRKCGEEFRVPDGNINRLRVPDLKCPAKITVHVTQDIIRVKFQSMHNHPLVEDNLKFQPFPKSVREKLKHLLTIGVDTKRLFWSVQSDKWDRENRTDDIPIVKEDQVSIHYLNQMKYELKKETRMFQDDGESTSNLILQLSQEKYNPVLLFKQQGENVLIGNYTEELNKPERKDQFIVAIQTEAQLNLMKEYGPNILLGDATHGTNQYGFQLYTLMIRDSFKKGRAVCSIITSREDTATLTAVFKEIKFRAPDIVVNTTMTDDEKVSKKAFEAAFGPHRRLLCRWHVQQTWKRNLVKIQCENTRSDVYECLMVILDTRKLEHFYNLVNGFKEKYSALCQTFVSYIDSEYLNRPEEWAMSFRCFFHSETDSTMHNESYHKVLKYKYAEGKSMRRVDELMAIILQLEKDSFQAFTILMKTINTSSSNTAMLQVQLRHSRGVSIPDNNVLNVSVTMWLVNSLTRGAVYSVVKISDHCKMDFCFEVCTTLACNNLCSHMYTCDCPDVSPLCKHMHKVHSSNIKHSVKTHGCTIEDPKVAGIVTPIVQRKPLISICEINDGLQSTNVKPITSNNQTTLNSALSKIQELSSLILDENLPDLSLIHTDKILRNTIRQCKIATKFKHITETPFSSPSKRIHPNEKPQKQVRFKKVKKVKREKKIKYPSSKKKELITQELQLSSVIEQPSLSESISFTPTLSVENCMDEKNCIGPYSVKLWELKTLDSYLSMNEINAIENITGRKCHVGWLTCNVIDSYLHVLCLQNVTFFHFAAYMIDYFLHTVQCTINAVRHLDCNTINTIFFPLNLRPDRSVSGCHWTLLICNLTEHTFEYLDPNHTIAPVIPEFVIEKLLSVLAPALHCTSVNSEPITQKSYKTCIHCHGQWSINYPRSCAAGADGKSCGVSVCHFAKMKLFCQSYETQFDALRFRVAIYNTLTRFKPVSE